MSTPSRLEAGQRRPGLVLLRLAQVYRLTLDDLVDAPATVTPGSTPRRAPVTA